MKENEIKSTQFSLVYFLQMGWKLLMT